MKYARMLDGRYALVLGGASAVGGAVARLFAEHGATVAAADGPYVTAADGPYIVEAGAQRTAAGLPPGVSYYDWPMASGRMPGLCAEVLKNFPRVDILVGATGFYRAGPTGGFPSAELGRMLDVNLGCAVSCFQRLLPGMLKHRRGEVILFAPDLADTGIPGVGRNAGDVSAAAACAGAICSFARNATNDYTRYHVRVNTVMYPLDGMSPRGGQDGPNGQDGKHPLSGRLGAKRPLSGEPEPADAANAALWYACDMSRFVIGERLSVNGGLEYAT